MADKPSAELRFPAGLSPTEEARWWDDHPEYWDQPDVETKLLEPQKMRRTTDLPYLRLPVDLVEGIKEKAVSRGVGYLWLIQMWLQERLEAEQKAAGKKRAKSKH